MKIVLIKRQHTDPWPTAPAAELIADSAYLPNNRPAFLPEMSPDNCTADIYLTLKVDRLGKSVAPKFATRYFNQWALAAHLRCPSLTDSSLAPAIDSSWIVSPWCDLPQTTLPVRVEITGIPSGPVNLATEVTIPTQTMAPESIAWLTKTATIKTGDQIATCSLFTGLPAKRGSEITATIHQAPPLKFRVR